MKVLSETYWESRYKAEDIGWDLGVISPPIKAYINQLEDKSIKILIPGAGNSHEAEYLFKLGFKNVFVVDLSKTALSNFISRLPDFPKDQAIHCDFFELNMIFDLILEQTFFCALHPSLRSNYVKKMNTLLAENGKIVGLLFNVPLNENHPPFGGSKIEYVSHFKQTFHIEIMSACYNSAVSRAGREVFIKLLKNN